MAHFSMTFWVSILLLFPGISAQSIGPSNDPLPEQKDDLVLKYSNAGMTNQVTVAPLTSNVGLGGSQTALNQVNIHGTIKAADAHGGSITTDNIAWICCDSNANTSNITPSDVVQQVVSVPPRGILLYSLIDSHCTLDGSYTTGSQTYGSILTMTNVKDSVFLNSFLGQSSAQPSATIQDRTVASSTGSGGASPSETNTATPTPTTAVAMSILYSITGIITLLFLTIIATGAIRAHRHPERYGPRGGGLPGRPRQSRAKGLARAMLETLPIVKFGDPEPAKPGSRDLELEEGMAGAHASPDITRKENTTTEDATKPTTDQPRAEMTGVAPENTSGIGPDIQPAIAARISREEVAATGSLGCSICTEDFEKGEDVRVLPCNHKYHPVCIDPWLLNVSGTCPLCRVDLRGENKDPTAEGAEEPLSPPLNDAEGTTSAEAGSSSGPFSDIIHLRNAPRNERIEALRGLRARERVASENHTDEQSRRARLTNRLKEKFRIRTHAVTEASESNTASDSTAQPASTSASPPADRS